MREQKTIVRMLENQVSSVNRDPSFAIPNESNQLLLSVAIRYCQQEMGDETLAKTLLIKRNARAWCRHCFRTREDDLVILSCFASLFIIRFYLKVVAQSRGKPCHKFLEQLTRRDNHNVKEQDAGPKFWSLQLDFG